jgi:hypothetical protein
LVKVVLLVATSASVRKTMSATVVVAVWKICRTASWISSVITDAAVAFNASRVNT